ncbi:XrtA system polysaccharide chain length determinant [Thalassotalea eurytherma]|uniref:Chain-length determining protein n=1 Tax=Thalassotalea eurytherma TaxID=1144278 RepID=A0ABQ6H6K9_9GAMM|nr:XrtA system polysaccharide chain length determinant [Thalassotalea eurytherma]GLX82086.1 chain-length determining protein [Thalassotalea eurytherma]
MQELFEQIVDYLKGIWIKRRYLMVATWVICPIGWAYVTLMDDVYESEARVYADTQSILRPLLKGITVENNPNVQIQLMVRTLLSRPNVEKITRMSDLDIQATTAQDYENLIERLKEDIDIKKVGRGRDENIYTISYENKDPEVARIVVQSALTVFIENTLGENRTDADAAQEFLDDQIREYESRLLAAEARLTDFKQKYSDVLPNQNGGYYEKLSTAKEQLKDIELSLLESKTQLKSAKQQLTIPAQNELSPGNAVQNSSTIKTTYDDRIAELEVNLDLLQLKYTEMHPEVIEVNRRLAHLKEQRTKEINEYIASTNSSSKNTLAYSENPVVQEAQIQVNNLENLVASLEVRAQNYREQVVDLENKIHTLPEIEAELVALNRGYEITQQKYEELLVRKETASLAQQADQTTNKIQFRVIDPPRVSSEPAGPNRALFYIIVTVLGFGVGVGLSLLISELKPVVTSGAQVSRATGIPVFGVVSATESLGLQEWHKKKTWLFILSNMLLLFLLTFFMIYSLFPSVIKEPIRGLMG